MQRFQELSGPAARPVHGLALFRVAFGLYAWLAPRHMNRTFGVRQADASHALVYMNRIFGVRAIALGTGYLLSGEDGRRLFRRLWLMCDAADTVAGAQMATRGELSGVSAALALGMTGGATAIDVAAIGGGG